MPEDVAESRNKYGQWDDDSDALAAALDGREPRTSGRNVGDRVVPNSDAVDEGFWRATRDSDAKYGR